MLDELKIFLYLDPFITCNKSIPIYAKIVKELSENKSGRKREEPQKVHLIGKLVDIMMGKT